MHRREADREMLLSIFRAALRSVNGATCVEEYFSRAAPPAGPVYALALGKAACAMARGALSRLGDRLLDACVVTKRGHAEALPWPVIEAGHPVPDERSLAAGQRVLEFSRGLPRDAHVLILLSGGASALVEALPGGVSLSDLQETTDWLLASGLDIASCNRIRKRLSLIKGGRLARVLAPRPVTCLAISDVPGDDPRVIGSGPVVPDPDLLLPLDTRDLPPSLIAAIAHGDDAPKPGDECFRNVTFEIVARQRDAMQAAAGAARALGYEAAVSTDFVSGDAAAAGERLAHELLRSEPGAVRIWGGETTVRLPPGAGRGGRNQSLALSAATVLRGVPNAYLLAAGTDGTDGPTEDAGALVDGGTVARGEAQGLIAEQSLSRADAGTFLAASGDLIRTGPTGTNVMDLIVGLVAGRIASG